MNWAKLAAPIQILQMAKLAILIRPCSGLSVPDMLRLNLSKQSLFPANPSPYGNDSHSKHYKCGAFLQALPVRLTNGAWREMLSWTILYFSHRIFSAYILHLLRISL
jgi:hypothetical protein